MYTWKDLNLKDRKTCPRIYGCKLYNRSSGQTPGLPYPCGLLQFSTGFRQSPSSTLFLGQVLPLPTPTSNHWILFNNIPCLLLHLFNMYKTLVAVLFAFHLFLNMSLMKHCVKPHFSYKPYEFYCTIFPLALHSEQYFYGTIIKLTPLQRSLLQKQLC